MQRIEQSLRFFISSNTFFAKCILFGEFGSFLKAKIESLIFFSTNNFPTLMWRNKHKCVHLNELNI